MKGGKTEVLGGVVITSPERRIVPDSKVGFSLGLCVADIMAGAVNEKEVKKIFAGTSVESPNSPEGWAKLLDDYGRVYWNDNPLATGVAIRLIESGKVEQPIKDGRATSIDISGGIWVSADKMKSEVKKRLVKSK